MEAVKVGKELEKLTWTSLGSFQWWKLLIEVFVLLRALKGSFLSQILKIMVSSDSDEFCLGLHLWDEV